MTAPDSLIETDWTPQGASCLTTTRLLNSPFIGCANPLPPCTEQTRSSSLLRSSVPVQAQ